MIAQIYKARCSDSIALVPAGHAASPTSRCAAARAGIVTARAFVRRGEPSLA
jgi:hypothetical protein